MSNWNHRGHSIELDANSGLFVCGELNLTAPSLAAMQKKIDAAAPDSNKLPRTRVLVTEYGRLVEATVTSVAQNTTYHSRIRVTKGSSSDVVSVMSIYPYLPDAAAQVAQLKANHAEILKKMQADQAAELKAMHANLGLVVFESVDALRAYCEEQAKPQAAKPDSQQG